MLVVMAVGTLASMNERLLSSAPTLYSPTHTVAQVKSTSTQSSLQASTNHEAIDIASKVSVSRENPLSDISASDANAFDLSAFDSSAIDSSAIDLSAVSLRVPDLGSTARASDINLTAAMQNDSELLLTSKLVSMSLGDLSSVRRAQLGGYQTGAHSSKREAPHYVPSYSARYLSLAQYQAHDVRPDYLLVYEFSSPPIPSLCKGFRIDFNPNVNWVLSATQVKSRLSGWKESNLQYRFTQQV